MLMVGENHQGLVGMNEEKQKGYGEVEGQQIAVSWVYTWTTVTVIAGQHSWEHLSYILSLIEVIKRIKKGSVS